MPPCSSTPSRPAWRARRAPSAKYCAISAICATVIFLALETVDRIALIGGAQAYRILDAVDVALAAAVIELHDELAVVRMDGLPHFTPERIRASLSIYRVVGHDAAAQVHRHERRDDSADPALRELDFPVEAAWLPEPS